MNTQNYLIANATYVAQTWCADTDESFEFTFNGNFHKTMELLKERFKDHKNLYGEPEFMFPVNCETDDEDGTYYMYVYTYSFKNECWKDISSEWEESSAPTRVMIYLKKNYDTKSFSLTMYNEMQE